MAVRLLRTSFLIRADTLKPCSYGSTTTLLEKRLRRRSREGVTKAAMGRPTVPYAMNEVLQLQVIGHPMVSEIQITELIKSFGQHEEQHTAANLAICAGTTQITTAVRAQNQERINPGIGKPRNPPKYPQTIRD
eukprot:2327923-Amphidinium_carterae.1